MSESLEEELKPTPKLNQYGLLRDEWSKVCEIASALQFKLMEEPDGEDHWDGQSDSIVEGVMAAYKEGKVRAALKEGPAVHVSAGDEAVCIQSTPGSGFPERPVREYIKQFHTLMTGISFVQYGEFRRYADTAEAIIADLQAQLKGRGE